MLRLAVVVAAALSLTTCSGSKRRVRPLSEAVKANIGLPGPTAPAPERLRMHAIDVGQGAATLFEFPCAAILVDTGGEDTNHFNSTKALMTYLNAFFDRRPDLNRTLAAVYVTHPHIDHTRGLGAVMAAFEVQHLVTNGQPRGVGVTFESGGEAQELAEKQAKKAGRLRTVGRTEVPEGGLTDLHIDPVRCDGVDPKLSVLWGGLKENHEGWEPRVFQNANNHSLVLKVDLDGHPVLVTGDLENEAIANLLTTHGLILNSDVYVVGHHGSHNGTTMDLMKTMTPCMAVMSMGDRAREEDWTAWKYGHPRKVTVQTVSANLGCSRPRRDVSVGLGMERFEGFTVDTALYGTGWEGTVVMELSERGTWKAVTER